MKMINLTVLSGLLSMLFLVCALSVFGQSLQITGRVTDANGAPLAGVSVGTQGSSAKTQTNEEGSYSINAANGDVLLFSSIGYVAQRITISSRTINVVMQSEGYDLDEVVVVGYGQQKKANLTGSVSTVSTQTLMERPVQNATTLLQGRIAGLEVTQSSGQPGRDGAGIQIRGLGSFGASSSPLVLIDGVIGSLADIAPNDIENVTVLKDAASASIYGSRAANGVILVTTKKADSKARIEYKVDIGVHEATMLPEGITNSAEYMTMANEAYSRSGQNRPYTAENISAYANAVNDPQYPNFDWVDHYFNPAMVYNHYLSLSNSGEKTSLRLSMNYMDQEGILPNMTHERYNAQLNVSNQLAKGITLGANIRAVYNDGKEPPFWDPSGVRYIFQANPLYEPYLPDGSGRKTAWAYPTEGHDAIAPVGFTNGAKYSKHYGLNALAFLNVDLYKGLTWRTNVAVNYAQAVTKDHIFETNEHYFYHKYPGEDDYTLNSSVVAPLGSKLSDNNSTTILPTIYSVLDYSTVFGDSHNLNALIGFEQQSMRSRYIAGSKESFPTKDLKELDAGANEGQRVSGSAAEWALQSYFGRLAYNYKGRYLVEGNIRYDGTSRVAKSNRWGTFPSVSAGWRISEEAFLKDRTDWLDNLKLRASWGILGNQEIGNYPYQDILNIVNYPFAGSLTQGAILSRLVDGNLRWESTEAIDIGMDLDIFKGLLGMSVDWFNKETYDILTGLPVPGSIGLSGPITNDGKLQNKGWEMELRHGKKFGDFSYGVNVVFSTYRNKLLSIVTPTEGVNEVGLPYNSYYLYEMEGIFQSQSDIDNSANHIFYSPRPGDIKIKDQDNNGEINADDRISMSPYPDYAFSVGLNLGWRNFNMSAFVQGVQGLNSRVYGWGFDPFVQSGFLPSRFRNAWTPENPSNSIPALYKGEGWISGYPGVYAYPSTYHLQDASYVRLKNVNISYDLPTTLTSKVKLQGVRIYVSGDNLLTFTKYPDLDPERPRVGSGGDRAAVFPQVRIFNVGVNVKF